MRILITNDDGIQGEGLLHLTKWAQSLGEVVVAAPMVEQSAKSHTIEIHKPFRAEQVDYLPGVTAWAVDSSPADCVRLMVLGKGEKFDLVLSGINRGLNLGSDIMYSGTVAAVFEAAALGLPAIAVSTEPKAISEAWQELDRIWDYFREHRLLEIHSLYNVNIPRQAGAIRITTQGGPYYSDRFPHVGNDLYRPTGYPIWKDRGDDTLDTDATLHGYITVTPLTIDKTNWEVYRKLTAQK